jgi:hypothetical protein
MFESLLNAYPPVEVTRFQTDAPRNPWPGGRVVGFAELTSAYMGFAFAGGIYRLHSQASGVTCDQLIRAVCPWLSPMVYSFGYDWLGRQFALDDQRMAGGEPLVLMCDLTTGEAFNIPATFADFHSRTLIEKSNAALNSDLFDRWAAANRNALPLLPNQIVGYRIPLSLGGKHEVANLEVVDFEVELELSGQIAAQIEAAPVGARIARIKSEEE